MILNMFHCLYRMKLGWCIGSCNSMETQALLLLQCLFYSALFHLLHSQTFIYTTALLLWVQRMSCLAITVGKETALHGCNKQYVNRLEHVNFLHLSKLNQAYLMGKFSFLVIQCRLDALFSMSFIYINNFKLKLFTWYYY